MAQNNLRIIYDNVIDSATLTASSAASGLPVTNLQKDQKGLVWRSTGTSATITAQWSTNKTLGGVILPFCNLSATATIRVQLYNSSNAEILDSGVVLAGAYTPDDLWSGGTQPQGVNAYSFGGGTYARCWFTATNAVRKLVITLNDSSNSSGYLEASRVVCGAYWSPTYNTNFGLGIGYVDTSTQTRTEAGNLVTTTKPMHRTLNFDLQWLVEADRAKLLSILRGNGLRKPLFVSVFPEDALAAKERDYQLYGKIVGLNPITHPLYTVYSSSLNLEEI